MAGECSEPANADPTNYIFCWYKINPRLIMPALGSDRVYVVDVKTEPRKPRLDKVTLMLES